MAATRNYARHLRVITVLQTNSRQLRNLITLTKCAIILKQILGINLSMLVCLLYRSSGSYSCTAVVPVRVLEDSS